MKILLTGEPGVGKSTLVSSVLEQLAAPKSGFLARERRIEGVRTGFDLVSSAGDMATLASVDSSSPIRVSRYGVDVASLDSFLSNLAAPTSEQLLYIDEIGQMELYSNRFKELVREYLDLGNSFLGTVTSIYDDEFVQEIKDRDDIHLLEVTTANRDILVADVVSLLS